MIGDIGGVNITVSYTQVIEKLGLFFAWLTAFSVQNLKGWDTPMLVRVGYDAMMADEVS